MEDSYAEVIKVFQWNVISGKCDAFSTLYPRILNPWNLKYTASVERNHFNASCLSSISFPLSMLLEIKNSCLILD